MVSYRSHPAPNPCPLFVLDIVHSCRPDSPDVPRPSFQQRSAGRRPVYIGTYMYTCTLHIPPPLRPLMTPLGFLGFPSILGFSNQDPRNRAQPQRVRVGYYNACTPAAMSTRPSSGCGSRITIPRVAPLRTPPQKPEPSLGTNRSRRCDFQQGALRVLRIIAASI